MLKKLRHKKTAKKIWLTLAIIIVPAFVFWGFGSFVHSQKEQVYAGRIFGKNITILEYKDALLATRNQAMIQFGDKFAEMQKYLNLEDQAWERLILLEEVKRHKIKVSDKELVELIESYPFFQNKGKFDNRMYAEMLRQVFATTPRVFEEQVRKNLMLAKLYQEFTKGVPLTDDEIKEAYRKANEEVSIYCIAALPADFVKDINPTEQDMKDYFAKNSADFKQPLSYNIEYLSSDSEEKIKNVSSRLNKKIDLSKIAKDSGLQFKETGLFTQTESIPGIGWSPQVLGVISKLKVGQPSPLINIEKKYYILRLKEKKDPYIPELEAIKDKVKEAFIKNKSKDIAKEKIESCLEKLRETYQKNPKSVDFEKIAKEFGLKFNSTGLFKYESYIESIGASDTFWIVAKGLKEDDIGGIIEMPLGYYIIKLKSRVPVDDKKFETEKDEFSKRLLEQKKQEYFTKFADELRNKAQIILY
jgi:parvulin-like peptidyl-prolyl isomerase